MIVTMFMPHLPPSSSTFLFLSTCRYATEEDFVVADDVELAGDKENRDRAD
jgi:hypothetical protein